jgi:hypothetical protein
MSRLSLSDVNMVMDIACEEGVDRLVRVCDRLIWAMEREITYEGYLDDCETVADYIREAFDEG